MLIPELKYVMQFPKKKDCRTTPSCSRFPFRVTLTAKDLVKSRQDSKPCYKGLWLLNRANHKKLLILSSTPCWQVWKHRSVILSAWCSRRLLWFHIHSSQTRQIRTSPHHNKSVKQPLSVVNHQLLLAPKVALSPKNDHPPNIPSSPSSFTSPSSLQNSRWYFQACHFTLHSLHNIVQHTEAVKKTCGIAQTHRSHCTICWNQLKSIEKHYTSSANNKQCVRSRVEGFGAMSLIWKATKTMSNGKKTTRAIKKCHESDSFIANEVAMRSVVPP